MVRPFQGRILVTDYSRKDDRDTVIENILKHQSSRAAVYLMLTDFRDIPLVLRKFPTVLPIVLNPLQNIDETRKILKFLPHMDHFVNFLGPQLAQEFLRRRETFRIKDVALSYVKVADRIVEKILESEGGIIFNVYRDNQENSFADIAQAIMPIKNPMKRSIKKLFRKRTMSINEASTSEREKLLPTQGESEDEEAGEKSPSSSTGTRIEATDSSSTPKKPNVFWALLVSLFQFCFPCFQDTIGNDTNIVLPIEQYPADIDARMEGALRQLHNTANEKWQRKYERAQDKIAEALVELEKENEKWKQKELTRLAGMSEEVNATTLSRNLDTNIAKDIVNSRNRRDLADVNRRASALFREGKLDIESQYSTNELCSEHYDYIIKRQIQKLISVWKQMRGFGFFS